MQAPQFKLNDQDGKEFDFYKELEKAPILVTFYPGDFTPVCTKQLCSYRDNYEKISGYGIQIVGISSDDEKTHNKFKSEMKFPFPLLSDPEKKVIRDFKCTSSFTFGLLSRAVVIVGKDREILYKRVEMTGLTHRNADDLVTEIQNLKALKKI